MNKSETMKRLAALGSEQTRKTYTRHGVTGKQFGVRYGDLGKLVKQIGADHALAGQLWKTNNHDAMVLATMIAAPGKMTATALDAWVRKVENHVILDALASLAVKTDHALRCVEKWTDSRAELIAAAGWQVLSGGCCGRPGKTASGIADQPDAFFETHLKRIEQTIHDSPNRVKHSMNGALIAIGLISPALQKKALAAAKRIGKVEVDHGDTSCKTPDAASYILKAAAHRAGGKTTKKKAPAAKQRSKKAAATA